MNIDGKEMDSNNGGDFLYYCIRNADMITMQFVLRTDRINVYCLRNVKNSLVGKEY